MTLYTHTFIIFIIVLFSHFDIDITSLIHINIISYLLLSLAFISYWPCHYIAFTLAYAIYADDIIFSSHHHHHHLISSFEVGMILSHFITLMTLLLLLLIFIILTLDAMLTFHIDDDDDIYDISLDYYWYFLPFRLLITLPLRHYFIALILLTHYYWLYYYCHYTDDIRCHLFADYIIWHLFLFIILITEPFID